MYPRAQVTPLERHDRPDGYDATVGLLLEFEDSSTTQVHVALTVTDSAWGSRHQFLTPLWSRYARR